VLHGAITNIPTVWGAVLKGRARFAGEEEPGSCGRSEGALALLQFARRRGWARVL